MLYITASKLPHLITGSHFVCFCWEYLRSEASYHFMAWIFCIFLFDSSLSFFPDRLRCSRAGGRRFKSTVLLKDTTRKPRMGECDFSVIISPHTLALRHIVQSGPGQPSYELQSLVLIQGLTELPHTRAGTHARAHIHTLRNHLLGKSG